MKIHRLALISLLAVLSAVTACKTTDHTKKTDEAAATKTKKPAPTTLRDQSGDVAFQSFLNRLRAAVSHHDVEALAGMMTADFGYSYEPGGEGPGVFKYWDENNIWPELQLVINERFVPNGAKFMVAPPEFAHEANLGEPYAGYRAGVVLQQGSWHFAYFVKGEDPNPPQ